MEERLTSHYESLSRAIRFVRMADMKAAPILALQVALVGTLAARFDKLLSILTRGAFDLEMAILLILLILYAALLIVVVSLASLVYMPRNPKTGRSIIYFEDIAAMRFDSFEKRAKQMSPEKIELQLLDQVHRVSQIVSSKMRYVRWAFILSLPSIVLWAALLAWGSAA